MRAIRRSVCATLFGVVLLAGCATVHPVPTTVVTPGMPNPEEALRQSIQHIDAEMAELGQLSPLVARPDTPVVPEDLQRIVSFQWSGPLDQAVAKLAQSVGYTFYTDRPAERAADQCHHPDCLGTRLQVFQALGEEAGTRATVQVDPLHHQVQVIHHV